MQDSKGAFALYYAAYYGHDNIVSLLMKEQDLRTNEGATALHAAAAKG